jgi:ABC-type sugar transport system ATPase subunit
VEVGSKPLIELEGIVKTFPGVRALNGVSFSVRAGEIHALCGENGAGKSTLIKVLAGAHEKDEGVIRYDGEEVSFRNTQESIDRGVSCIYQELSIIPLMDAAHNIFIGNIPKKKNGLVDYKALYKNAEELLARMDIDIPATAVAGGLSVGQQQMLEIARALTRKARVIIMDEPTSSLSEKETETLYEICAHLKRDNVAIIYISHKLDEVMRLADRVTVIRDGENIVTKDIKDIGVDEIISNMIGRKLEDMYHREPADTGDVSIEVKNLSRKGVFEDVSFRVRAGEIVGFFGLVGAGRSEIMRAVFGADPYDSGEVLISGKRIRRKDTSDSIRKGLALATEDRKKEGLMLKLPILTNITLLRLKYLSRCGIIDRRSQRRAAQQYVDEISIKTSSLRQLAVNLSGGNQQKVVLAKWLMTSPRALILDEPTRGIDVGSKAEIYRLVNRLAKEGVAIVVVSSEIEEVMGMSDSIVTVASGRITAKFSAADRPTREQILAAAI